MNLEQKFRLLARAFPADWRARHEGDMVAMLLDQSDPGQRSPSIGDVVDIVSRGVETRSRRAGPAFQILIAMLILVVATGVVDATVTPVSWSFFGTSMVVVLIPGTGVIYSISTAIASGWRRGSIAAMGCTLGIVPHLVAAAIGLSGMMQASARAFELVRWIGVAYLVHLAVGMLRSTGQLGDLASEEAADVSPWSTIRQAVLINMLNPKLTIFFFAFMPQFIDTKPTFGDPRLLGLSAVFMALTLAVFLVYVAFASSLRSRVLGRPRLLRRIERSLGLALAGFAVRLAVADR